MTSVPVYGRMARMRSKRTYATQRGRMQRMRVSMRAAFKDG
jgi:hypothetical protein